VIAELNGNPIPPGAVDKVQDLTNRITTSLQNTVVLCLAVSDSEIDALRQVHRKLKTALTASEPLTQQRIRERQAGRDAPTRNQDDRSVGRPLRQDQQSSGVAHGGYYTVDDSPVRDRRRRPSPSQVASPVRSRQAYYTAEESPTRDPPGRRTSPGRNMRAPTAPADRNMRAPTAPTDRNMHAPTAPTDRNMRAPTAPTDRNMLAQAAPTDRNARAQAAPTDGQSAAGNRHVRDELRGREGVTGGQRAYSGGRDGSRTTSDHSRTNRTVRSPLRSDDSEHGGGANTRPRD
jgi:hypothetical protein